MQNTIVIVDPFSSGRYLAPAFKAKHGIESIAVISPDVSPVLLGDFQALDFRETCHFDGDLEKLAVAVQGGPPCRASRPQNHQCFRGSAADVPPDPRKKGKQSSPFLPPRERSQLANHIKALDPIGVIAGSDPGVVLACSQKTGPGEMLGFTLKKRNRDEKEQVHRGTGSRAIAGS